MATPALRVSGLAKRFGARQVLAGLDLEIDAGSAFGLVGANGAGKTTLIKCVLDLCAADGGAIEIYGVPSGDAAARRRLAFVPERFTPPKYLLGREFLELVLSLAGAAYDRARAAAVLAELELAAEALERPVGQLSKGMTQKLGLAASFLVDKDLYILDEPMSGLDPASRVAVKSVLGRLHRAGRTVFFTSHVLSDVEELCSAIGVLDDGALRFRGAPAELSARYGEPQLERAFLKCIRSHGERAAGRA